ncbi:MAG: Uma2 family endonuclease [Alphaproteobacteria bacterium]|nr:Uma2 family endonuclease [Alphaproteobacteria bacterium]
MSEAPELPPRMSLAAFLEWDDGTDARYELLQGRIVAMAPSSDRHAAIVIKLGTALSRRLKPPCLAYVEGGASPATADDTYFLPDVMVSYTPPTGAPIVRDPLLVSEILSPSTRTHDRGNKLPLYQEMPSVMHVLLLDQDRRRVEHFRRSARGWEQTTHLAGGTLALDALGFEVAVDEIYEGIA